MSVPSPRHSDAFDPQDPDHVKILDLIRRDVGAFLEKDIEELSSCYVQDDRMTSFIVQPGRGLFHNDGFGAFREGLAAGMGPGSQPSRAVVNQRNLRINVRGDTAWAVFEEVVDVTDDPVEPPRNTHNARVFERHEGVWKIVFHAVFEPRSSYAEGPLVEVGADGTVLWQNEAATAVALEQAGLIVSGGRLRARDRAYSKTLAKAIVRAGAFSKFHTYNAHYRATGQRASFPVLLSDPEAGGLQFCMVAVVDYRIWVSFGDAVDLRGRIGAAAVIFGLSRAQETLAQHIADGRSLPDAAEAMGVTTNTVRTHLRRLFDKTGTHSQTALLRVLLSVG